MTLDFGKLCKFKVADILSEHDGTLFTNLWGTDWKHAHGQGVLDRRGQGKCWWVKVADCKFVKVGTSKLILVHGGEEVGGQNALGGTSNDVVMDGNDEDGLDLGDSDDSDVDDPDGAEGPENRSLKHDNDDWVPTFINVDQRGPRPSVHECTCL